MKCLIIYCHPNPKSFNHAIKETFSQALKAQGHEVLVRDLYAMRFNPVLSARDLMLLEKKKVAWDIKQEQGHVRRADAVVFIFPVWWDSLPAIGRGYIDRVLCVNFAYTQEGKGLLQGKKALVICTMNAPAHVCEKGGVFKAMDITIGQCLAGFCGMTLIEQRYFNSVASASHAERQSMLDEVRALAGRVF